MISCTLHFEMPINTDEILLVLPNEHMISTEQYAVADRDLPTEAELSVEAAVQIVLSHYQEEDQTDSSM